MRRNFIEWAIGAMLMLYGIYEGWNYTGIYKLIAETQLDLMGSYGIKLTIVLEMVALMLLWWGILRLFRALFGLEPGRVEQFILRGVGSSDNRKDPHILRHQAKMAVFIGLALLLVVSAAAFLADRYWQDPPLTALVLGKDLEPKSSYVEIEGFLQPQFVVEYAEKSTTGATTHYVIPLTPPEWKKGDPLQYFIDTGITSFQDVHGKFHNYNNATEPFKIKHNFYVNRNGLKGLVRAEYERYNILLKEPHYELVSSRVFAPQDVGMAWGVAVFLITLCTLGAALGSIMGARRLEKGQ